ncbi:MAG: hypothetical protein ISEC1_P1932 [Thiomicrorhabdus sp.]|nr:MAG: hypothetical protein ISEC1_P1932 [Thiomicrorhabdus sp.]
MNKTMFKQILITATVTVIAGLALDYMRKRIIYTPVAADGRNNLFGGQL